MARQIGKTALVTKMNKLVSDFVIKRDGKCVVCGSTSKLSCGHVFSRRHLNTKWDVTPDGNCHCQCWSCNFKHTIDTVPYYRWYQQKFGMKKFDELYKRWIQVKPMKMWELMALWAELKTL
jgi:hypothetical protein